MKIQKSESKLLLQNDEISKTTAPGVKNKTKPHEFNRLNLALRELAYQNIEREKRATELIVANKELVFQNQEKEKRAAELVIANLELVFQYQEKENLAAELLSANQELAYQNQEKERRAAELLIANRELAYQNKEKEDRATELLIANRELAYQNQEKENRAAELIVANKKLALENRKKEEIAQKMLFYNKELKEVEKRLIDANLELASFSYSVSHDLRAPLRVIVGFSAMLQEEYVSSLDAEANRIVNVIIENTKMMSRLIDDLLRFSKMARLEVINHSLDTESIVKKCIAELLLLEKKPMADITINDLPACQGDESMLKQVWYNLIGNALKYTSKTPFPKIEIGCSLREDNLVYYITDNGSGFDMEYYHKLFGVFQRLHSHEEFEGTGLGLALVKRIIHKHNGEIWAESVPGERTTFYFSIPKDR
jgi:signal transduction histidine kinase